MSLKFSPSGHRYTLDGKAVPGVTTLLGKGLPKPAIPYWAARTVAEYVADNPDGVDQLRRMGRAPMVASLKEVPWQKRDEAAVRGTDVHAIAERLIHGTPVDVPEHLVDHVEGYAHWLDDFGVEALFTESPVAHRAHWWAGTFDAIIRFTRGPWAGRIVLADWKTSSGVYGETALQTATYASAEFMARDGSEVALPHIESTGVVHVTAGGSQFYPLNNTPADIADAYGVFRHIAYVANRTDWIKARVGAPMEVTNV